MIKSYEKSGKTEDEAIAAALADLGLERDDVSVEIVERAKSGFLGIGASPAVIRINYESPDEAPAERPAAPAPKAETPRKPAASVTAVPDDEICKKAVAFIEGLLERMGVRANIEVTPKEGSGYVLNLSGSGIGAVIGRRGETLDAIQHLTNYAANRGNDKRIHISVDAEGYRSRREESLVSLAEKMAAKVVKYKRSMSLEPMNSYERHVIHSALQDYEGVTTGSTGTEPNRRVVVSYDKSKANEHAQTSSSREWS